MLNDHTRSHFLKTAGFRMRLEILVVPSIFHGFCPFGKIRSIAFLARILKWQNVSQIPTNKSFFPDILICGHILIYTVLRPFFRSPESLQKSLCDTWLSQGRKLRRRDKFLHSKRTEGGAEREKKVGILGNKRDRHIMKVSISFCASEGLRLHFVTPIRHVTWWPGNAGQKHTLACSFTKPGRLHS